MAGSTAHTAPYTYALIQTHQSLLNGGDGRKSEPLKILEANIAARVFDRETAKNTNTNTENC